LTINSWHHAGCARYFGMVANERQERKANTPPRATMNTIPTMPATTSAVLPVEAERGMLKNSTQC
jgi:hypothetical protein